MFFAALDIFHNSPGIGQTAGYADIERNSFVGNRKFLDTLISSGSCFCHRVHRRLIMLICKTAEHSLGNTACNAEDHAGTGTKAEGHITGFRNKSGKLNAGIADHTDHLSSSDNHICILFSLGIAVWTKNLHFLGRTRHDRNHKGFLALVLFIASVVFFHNCGEHALRGTAGRKMVFVFRILITEEFYPGRAAGGEQRKLISLSQTFQEFLGFFHDGQVGGKSGVVYFIKSHTVKHSYQLAHNAVTFVQSEGISHSYPDSRSYLSHYSGIRICNGLPYLVHMGFYADSASGTVNTALAAADTVCFG